MMIEVELSEWEQHCCGDPFRIGATVTWKLVARAPIKDAGTVRRYREEHHGETPEHVPHLPVTGTVRTIQGLHYAFDEGPHPGELTVRPSNEVAVGLDAVPGAGTQLPGYSAEHRLLVYRVRLEVAEDAVLPGYVGDGQDDWLGQGQDRGRPTGHRACAQSSTSMPRCAAS